MDPELDRRGLLCGAESVEGFSCLREDDHLQASTCTSMDGAHQSILIPDALDEGQPENFQRARLAWEGSLSELDALANVHRGSADFPLHFADISFHFHLRVHQL